MKIKKLAFIFALLSATTSISQVKKFIDTGSVNNQFEYLITKSNRYQTYKVVELNWLTKLKSNVLDSLSASKNSIATNLTTINAQKKTIEDLNKALNNSKTTIQSLTTRNQSIAIFGLQFGKSVFKLIVFSIIGILLILLGIFIIKFKRSNYITLQSKERFIELEEEFENHRKIAIEREQKVRRQLQDELNKQKKE
jgi:tetrahydromethanopterin S-methyltransferase subunit B